MRTTIFGPNNLQIELAVNKERLRVTEDRLHVTEAQSQTNHVLSHEAIDEAAKKGLIPPEIVAASHDFVSIRNDIAHDSGFEFDDALFSSIATGIKLLKIISAKDLSV